MLSILSLRENEEQHETFICRVDNKPYVQFDYRAEDGTLFSMIAPTLSEARHKRDHWLINRTLDK